MLTLKFGGSSLDSARGFATAADIIAVRAAEDRLSVVVAAVAGVSDRLHEGIARCTAGESPLAFVETIRAIHAGIILELGAMLPGFDAKAVSARLFPLYAECERLLAAVAALGECSVAAECRIMGMGERLCLPLMEAALRAKDVPVQALDSCKLIFTTGSQTEGEPDFVRTQSAFAPYAQCSDVLLLAGFICSWYDAQAESFCPGLLGRSGSDVSAALAGAALGASRVEFWSGADGIFTADPGIVSDASRVEELSYEEAMELSFFGSKILHPKTLAPLAAQGIDALSLDSRNPSARGTRIGRAVQDGGGNPVRGISCLKDCAVVSVSGSGMKGRAGTASRVFAAAGRAGVSVLLITQSSSEYTISFCVRQEQTERVCAALNNEFCLEMQDGLINPIDVKDSCAVVSIVGDRMRQNSGVAATFFSALASRDINILAIAQGSSERSISAVIAGADGDMAVRVAHRFFFCTAQSIEVFVFGTGAIGGALLDQIRSQRQDLLGQKIDIKVIAVANSKRMLLDGNGLCLRDWRDDLRSGGTACSLDSVLDFVRNTRPLNPVFVDCSASCDLPERYIDILEAGMHIATPNKRANSMDIAYYRRIRRTANRRHRRFLYETNVGAGLPIIDTLQNLFKSGDRLLGFDGIMSGSLSYIFGRLDEGVPFSRAVLEAREKRFTEPDPRDDLSGMDVARKALIIAREAGLELELSDVQLRRVFPEDFDDSGSTDEFLRNLPKVDSFFAEKIGSLRAQGKVLRMGASIKDGHCAVGMLEVDAGSPLYAVRGGENAFVFSTVRYSPIPLTVRGYGAGADVTAAGVFGDILRTVSFNPEV